MVNIIYIQLLQTVYGGVCRGFDCNGLAVIACALELGNYWGALLS